MKRSVARSIAPSVLRSVARSTALGLCAAAMLAIGGCNQNGSYRLSWVFGADATAGAESTSTGCGRHFVDSILATGSDDSGDAQQIQALCTPGWVTAEVPPGTWSFTVQMLDSQGALIKSAPPDMMTMMTSAQPIATDGPQVQFSVSLWPTM
jgi:hypothetical protein